MSRRSASPRASRPRPNGTTVAWSPPTIALLLATTLVAAIVHGGALTGGFASDDFDFLMRVRNADLAAWGWARPLPGLVRWSMLTTVFGAQPLPHLLFAFLLHAGCAALLVRIGLRAGLPWQGALAAGVLLAGTTVAWTSTHWASGMGEVMAGAFALGALALHLECRAVSSARAAWFAGACAVGAVMSKESALLLPLAIAGADACVAKGATGRGALAQVVGLGVGVAAAVLVAWGLAPHVAGEAYAMSLSPYDALVNLSTYAAWLVRMSDPVRDRLALPDAALLLPGLAVLLVWAAGVWFERRSDSRPITAGLLWFVLMLLPVLPLQRHTHLYYLVVPFAGVALAAGAVLGRLTQRVGQAAGTVLVVLLLSGYVAVEATQSRARASERGGGVLVDRVARESGLIRNALASLREAKVVPGDTIVIINPYPLLGVDPSRSEVSGPGGGFGSHAYIPLVAALREGRALPLLMPGVTVLGMGDGVPPEWMRARVFQFDNEGGLADLGRGTAALDTVATAYLEGSRWADADAALSRLAAAGVDTPWLRERWSYARSRLAALPGATGR